MEKLIEYLLGHIYFVIVVLFMLYGMFFRKSPLEKRPPNRMPDFGGGGSPYPRRTPSAEQDAPGPDSRNPSRNLSREAPRESTFPPGEPGVPGGPGRTRPEWAERPPVQPSRPPRRSLDERERPVRQSPPEVTSPVYETRGRLPATARDEDGDSAMSAVGTGLADPTPREGDRRPSSALSRGKVGEAVAARSPRPATIAGLPRGELARAVVLAEVLGPPRSRKPLRR